MTNTKYAWGALTDLIIAVLREHGPMTINEVAAEIGEPSTDRVRKIAHRLYSCEDWTARRIHIRRWQTGCVEGAKAYPRPVLAAGPGPNAAKPPARSRTREYARQCWHLRAKRLRSSSVFNLGQPIHTLR